MQRDILMWKKYFILRAVHSSFVPGLNCLIENSEIYINIKAELASPLEMAHLESRSLACKFREACIKRFKKRYGDMFDLDIVECSTRENNIIQKRIKIDSSKIKQRLAGGNITHHNRAKPSLCSRVMM